MDNHHIHVKCCGSPCFLDTHQAELIKILLDKLHLPSMSILRRFKSGSIDAIKAAKVLKENNSISEDIILMADELYLLKSTKYSGGQSVGTDEKRNLYKGVVVFMIHGLKSSVPIVVKAVPEVTVNGQWLAEEISNCISNLAAAGFRIRGIVTDYHSANVAAFSNFLQMYSCNNDLCIQHPKNSTKTYMFFDNVHLLKNIRNNVLNSKKFVFPSFLFFI